MSSRMADSWFCNRSLPSFIWPCIISISASTSAIVGSCPLINVSDAASGTVPTRLCPWRLSVLLHMHDDFPRRQVIAAENAQAEGGQQNNDNHPYPRVSHSYPCGSDAPGGICDNAT